MPCRPRQQGAHGLLWRPPLLPPPQAWRRRPAGPRRCCPLPHHRCRPSQPQARRLGWPCGRHPRGRAARAPLSQCRRLGMMGWRARRPTGGRAIAWGGCLRRTPRAASVLLPLCKRTAADTRFHSTRLLACARMRPKEAIRAAARAARALTQRRRLLLQLLYELSRRVALVSVDHVRVEAPVQGARQDPRGVAAQHRSQQHQQQRGPAQATRPWRRRHTSGLRGHHHAVLSVFHAVSRIILLCRGGGVCCRRGCAPAGARKIYGLYDAAPGCSAVQSSQRVG